MAELQLGLFTRKPGRPPGKAKPFVARPLHGLKARRLALGLSLEELGELIAVNKSHMAKIESGRVRLDIVRAAILAERLGCDIGALL